LDRVKRQFTATHPNRLWEADITYVATWTRNNLETPREIWPAVRHRQFLGKGMPHWASYCTGRIGWPDVQGHLVGRTLPSDLAIRWNLRICDFPTSSRDQVSSRT